MIVVADAGPLHYLVLIGAVPPASVQSRARAPDGRHRVDGDWGTERRPNLDRAATRLV